MKKKHSVFSKALCVILSAIMLLSAIPLTVIGFAEETSYAVGDVIEFGSYPQTKVTDTTITAQLNSLAGSTDNWTSYGYMEKQNTPGDYMKYTDVEYNGEKYRGVYFTQYRPSSTISTASTSAVTYQDDNSYTYGNKYWFKYEPIEWVILEAGTGGLAISNNVLDSQAYCDTQYENKYICYSDSSYSCYCNNWEHSTIRAWLNSIFFDTSFTPSEQNNINRIAISTPAYSTSYSKYDSADTSDKVFLLSYNDVQDTVYGFKSVTGKSLSLCKSGTDYAKSQGLCAYYSNSTWLLRTASNSSSITCCVERVGTVSSTSSQCTSIGVVPALYFQSYNHTDDSDEQIVYDIGDIIEYGSYPQTEVTDTTITEQLETLAGDTDDWTSYRYMSSGDPSDYMRYKDVEYNGEKYRGIYFNLFRPAIVTHGAEPPLKSNCDQFENGYRCYNVYWFKYEPIQWVVLEAGTGGLAVCKNILDSQAYCDTYYRNSEDGECYGDSSYTYYCNNWEHSTIRTWLNSTFINTAFTATEQNNIVETTISNTAISTAYSEYDSADTSDKVFLPSYDDVQNTVYGFYCSAEANKTKLKIGTDYAKAQGLWVSSIGCSAWRLRSAGDKSDCVGVVGDTGEVESTCSSMLTCNGIAPALYFRDYNPLIKNKVGNVIEYGSYPQTEVTDTTITAQLEDIAGSTDNWTSYNYMAWQNTVGDYMKYKDVEYNGDKYRGVYFSRYRPHWITDSASTFVDNFQDNNGYIYGKIYWFKFEPIEWVILEAGSGGLAMCKNILDSQAYCDTYYNGYSDSAKKYYCNNWEHSTIRTWLNSTFINTAFTSTQQNNIVETTISTPAYSTSWYHFDSADTSDKVFLLSYTDVQNINYGFASGTDKSSTRQKTNTDYAKSQGLWGSSTDRSSWQLRSAGSGSHYTCDVSYDGMVSHQGCTNYTCGGVAAALYFKIYPNRCEHSYKSVETASTCTTKGYTTHTCTNCGFNYVDTYKQALGHDSTSMTQTDEYLKSAATCTAQALYYYKCSRCTEKGAQTYKVGTALGHDFTSKTKTNEYLKSYATCTEPYVYYYKCSRCTEKSTETYEAGTALGHYFASKTQTDEYRKSYATCTEPAVYYYKCSRCTEKGTETYEVGTALGHYFSSKTQTDEYLQRAATCTEKAVYYYKCSRCTEKGTTTYEAGTALGHDFTSMTQTYSYRKSAATCTEPAVYYYKCSRCTEKGTETYEEGTALGHNFTAKTQSAAYLKSAATCTENAVYYYKCSRCSEKGTTTYRVGSAKGHDWGEWTTDNNGNHTRICKNDANHIEMVVCSDFSSVVTPSTCMAKGYTTYTCKDCGYKYTADETEMLAHTYTEYVEEVTPATCLNNATATYKCANCTATTVKEVENTKLAHDYSGDVKNNEDGTHSFKCVNGCDKYGEAVACSDFSSVVTPETCTSKGYTTYICKDCGYEYTADETEMLAHTYTEYVEEVTPATCLKNATATYKCANCTATIVKEVENTKLAHDYSGDIKDNKDGTHSFKCVNGCDDYGNTTVCDYVNEGELVTAATCLANAVYTYSCECGAEKNNEKANTKLAHDYSGDIKDNKDGTHSFKCVNGCEGYGNDTACVHETEGKLVKAATCLKDAVYTYSCVCGAEKNLDKADTKLDHDYSGDVKNNEDGTHSFKCVNGCDDYGNATACEYVNEGELVTAATCLANAVYTYSCECGAEKNNEKANTKLAHDYSGDVKNNEDGTHSFKCVNGCEEYGGTVACSDFSSVVTPETCTRKGFTTYTCKACGYEYTDNGTEMLAHNYTVYVEEVTAATCLKNATATYKCATCPATTVKEVENSKLNHSYTGAIKNNGNGTHSFKCVNGCDKYGSAVKCKNFSSKVTTQPTYKTKGKTTYTCKDCGYSYTLENIDMLFLYGDIDRDGNVTAADARLALRASVNLESYPVGTVQFSAGDVDVDGTLTAADARLILRASVGLEKQESLGKKR